LVHWRPLSMATGTPVWLEASDRSLLLDASDRESW
jgi:hypothetical protein